MATAPRIPKGTRDFGPLQAARRTYIFDTIRSVFQQYGFLPIETPAMETLDTLLGKYGEEGDRLIFKVLNSGNYFDKIPEDQIRGDNFAGLAGKISDKALRYDLTVPFARFVVKHQGELAFPFKRYQIQPVWRADRPQKGRYREFYQCDVDMIGSNSLRNEIELVEIIDQVFSNLGLEGTRIQINNRKILAGLAEALDAKDQFSNLTVAIDKLDKVGPDGVLKELEARGLGQKVLHFFSERLNSEEGMSLDALETLFNTAETASEIGQKGVEELRFIFNRIAPEDLKTSRLDFNFTLARGLNYYTGAIFEVIHPDFKGSICGGGRYDDLTGIFGLPNTSGVGVSFGADRIYDLLGDKNLFPETIGSPTQLLFINFGEAEADYCSRELKKVRAAGIAAELFPDSGKMKKQMNYANNKNIAYVALVGSNEMESGKVSLKNMQTGEQQSLSTDEMINLLKNN